MWEPDDTLVIKWSNRRDVVAHNALKKMVARLVWRGTFFHTYKETEEYIFFFLPGSLLDDYLTSVEV